MRKILFLAIVFTAFLAINTAHATVIINEIAWMGTTISANNEWIELYNESNQEIDLTGWTLKSTDGTPSIELQGKVPSWGFFLLERTDDDTVPNIPADQIYQGALNNTGEKLILSDNTGQIIDTIDCSGGPALSLPNGWLAGDNTTKQTMERRSMVRDIPDTTPTPTTWQNSQNPGGTPRQINSTYESPTSIDTLATTKAISTTATIPSYEVTPRKITVGNNTDNIFINEVLSSPKGSDEENEWIELYNVNNSEVDLTDWQIRDTIGAVKTYILPDKSKIPSMGFLVLTRPQTKITLQNSGDGLELLSPNGKIIDKVEFSAASQDQAWARTTDGQYKWTTILTPIKPNAFPITNALNPTQGQSSEVSSQRIDNNAIANIKELANKQSSGPVNPLLSFLIGIGVAAISAIIVLILYKKFSLAPPDSNFY